MLITIGTWRVKRTLNGLLVLFKLVAIATLPSLKTDIVLLILKLI